MKSRFFSRWMLLSSVLIYQCTVSAAEYPSKPIKLIVGFSAGGTSDVIARIVAEDLRKKLGQTVIVENKTGGGGMIAARQVAGASPDGYTLLLGSAANFVINPHLTDKLGYDPLKDFSPAGSLAKMHYVVLVRKDLPVSNIEELVHLAKKNPGKLTFGSPGIGSSSQLAVSRFAEMASINLEHVPYKGAADALKDLIGGHIDVLFDALPTAILPVKTNMAKALATTGMERSSELPKLPTLNELDFKNYESGNWMAIFAPQKTDQKIIDRLNKEINSTLSDPQVAAQLERAGNVVLGGTPGSLNEMVNKEYDYYKNLIQRLKIN